MLVYFVSVSINAANILLAEVGIGFGIAVTVIILALTINMLARMEQKKAGTKNPPPGSSGTSTPVKEIRGLFPTKPRLTARQRNGPSDEENGMSDLRRTSASTKAPVLVESNQADSRSVLRTTRLG